MIYGDTSVCPPLEVRDYIHPDVIELNWTCSMKSASEVLMERTTNQICDTEALYWSQNQD